MPYPTASSGNERTFSSLHNLISTTDISSKITYANEHFWALFPLRVGE